MIDAMGKVRVDPAVPGSVVKTYPQTDTLRFKCWDSGAYNEAVAGRLLPDIVPRTLDVWADGSAEYVRLERLDGDRLDPVAAADDELRRVGEILGRIHSCEHFVWGSLSGRVRFMSARAAFASRFRSAVRLLAEADPGLAADVASWSAPRLATARWDGRPTLVHGDYGATNVLCSGDRIRVIDWEHARWGHPLEDWAKIWFSIRFPEPNGFSTDSRRIRLIEQGWQDITGRPPPRNPTLTDLLNAYFAICLGVFFSHRDPNHRLEWLRSRVRPP
ncbi:MAG TPA: aminoglycoside phosphotransferase family protein [Streptosporangiaceae bacterium]|nr:aminoglycoside phosphotransferase family protein [Streptosporangiaceae bacterium]